MPRIVKNLHFKLRMGRDPQDQQIIDLESMNMPVLVLKSSKIMILLFGEFYVYSVVWNFFGRVSRRKTVGGFLNFTRGAVTTAVYNLYNMDRLTSQLAELGSPFGDLNVNLLQMQETWMEVLEWLLKSYDMDLFNSMYKNTSDEQGKYKGKK